MTVADDIRDIPRVSIWNDPRLRGIFFQVLLVAVLAFLAWEIVQNTIANLQRLNKDLGYGFLSKTAGFDIIQQLVPYSSSSNYGMALYVGFLNTILISVLGIIGATVIGFVMGIMRLSKNWLAARIATVYIDFFRNIPLLLQIFIWYKFVIQFLPDQKVAPNPLGLFFISNRGLMLPRPEFGDMAWLGGLGFLAAIVVSYLVRRWARIRQAATGQPYPVFLTSLALLVLLPLLGLALAGFPLSWDIPHKTVFNFSGGYTVIPELIAMFLALSIYTGTFIAEAVRAGVQSVSHGQTEASHALGLRNASTLRLVVVPQAMRVVSPPLASTYLSLTKNSSLAVAIGYPDLVATGGTVLNQTGKAIEIVSMWMFVYLSLSLFTSLLMNWFNARMKLVER